jgi:hypothetical protein
VFSTAFRPALGPTQPPIQCVPGTLPPGVKRPGLEADHSPPSIDDVKNGRATALRPHGIVLNLLSPGTTLPFTCSHKGRGLAKDESPIQ